MANKPTKAEYEGFKKAVANPMTPAPIKQKLQSIIDQYSSEYEGGSEEPKAEPKKRGRKPATPKATKKSPTDIEQAKAQIKAKTGKTEEECEAIIEQYRALRSKAQEGKRKAEQASATNKKRVEKLEQKGDLIEGTNVKTADAVIETTAKDVAEKIEQQIEAVEEKAEKEAKAEVAKDKTIKTTTEKKEAVEAKVEKKVKEKTKTIVKRVVIDTSALLTSIADSLGKFDKDSQKEFLIKLRSDIDKLLVKYAFGGMTDGAVQTMNVQQSNLSSSSVNPTMFAKGGGVEGGAKIRIDSVNMDVYEDSYEEGEGSYVIGYSRDDLVGKLVNPKELVSFLSKELFTSDSPSNYSVMDGAIFTSQLVDEESNKPSERQEAEWKKGDLVLYSENFRIGVSIIHPTETTDEELSKLTGIGLYKKGGKVKMSSKFAKGGGVISVYELRKGDKIKTRKGDIETIERKIESGYFTYESKYSHPFESIEFVERPKRKMANGGVVGQEIVFDDMGTENTGVIKEITNLGDYVVKADDGRTLLAQRELDVISFGAMRQQGVEQRKKRFGFFDEGGNVSDLDYSDILAVLEEKLTDAVANDIPNTFENSYNAEGEEVEHQSRDGFIAYTDGGFEVRWFEYLSGFWGSGYSLPTSALDEEKERQIDYSLEMAKEYFIDQYPEIVEELGEDNINYNSLYEAGYESEAEELSEAEMENMDGTIMCEVGAYYYTPNNDRGIEDEHTLRLFGLVNLESPYHRNGNLEDRYDIDITFNSIEELEEKVDAGLKEITEWFNGSNYDESTKELRIVRMAKGGGVENKLSYEEFVKTLRDDDKINTYTGKTTTGMKMYYLPQGHPFLNMKFSHKNKRKAYNEYLSVGNKKGFAKGGLTEHGLKVGDRIEKKLDAQGEVIRVKNKKENAFVHLDNGFRMPIGGDFTKMKKGGNVSSMLRNRRGM